jgi:hypothetical protein
MLRATCLALSSSSLEVAKGNILTCGSVRAGGADEERLETDAHGCTTCGVRGGVRRTRRVGHTLLVGERPIALAGDTATSGLADAAWRRNP